MTIDGGVAKDGTGEGEDDEENDEGAQQHEDPGGGADALPTADFAGVQPSHEQGESKRQEQDQREGLVSGEAQGGAGHGWGEAGENAAGGGFCSGTRGEAQVSPILEHLGKKAVLGGLDAGVERGFGVAREDGHLGLGQDPSGVDA